jgi:hypothetical protein
MNQGTIRTLLDKKLSKEKINLFLRFLHGCLTVLYIEPKLIEDKHEGNGEYINAYGGVLKIPLFQYFVDFTHDFLIGFEQPSGDVYSHINTAKATDGYAAEQIKEEIRKARIYMNVPDVKQIIQEPEDCNFCRGRIQFALGCLSIVDTVTDIIALEIMKTCF